MILLAAFAYGQSPDPYRKGAEGSVYMDIRTYTDYGYGLCAWNWDPNVEEYVIPHEVGTYKTRVAGEYVWTAQNLKLRYQDLWSTYYYRFNITQAQVNARLGAGVATTDEFTRLFGTWVTEYDQALTYRNNFKFYDREDGTEQAGWDLPSQADILQLLGQMPRNSGSLKEDAKHFFYANAQADGTNSYGLPALQNYSSISGLAIPPMGLSENNFDGERNWYGFGYGFALRMKEPLTVFSLQDAQNTIIVGEELYHFSSARYCKPISDQELGYKLYVDNCNDAVVMYPYNKQTKLTELPKGLERGIALRYANRSQMKIYRKWSEICAESEEIRKSISGNIPQLNLPESPCEEDIDAPDPYEKGPEGSVFMDIRTYDDNGYGLCAWDWDKNVQEFVIPHEVGTYKTRVAGEYVWTAQNLKLKYQDLWSIYYSRFNLTQAQINARFGAGAPSVDEFTNLFGTWATEYDYALNYRFNFKFYDRENGAEQTGWDLPSTEDILQLLGQMPRNSGSLKEDAKHFFYANDKVDGINSYGLSSLQNYKSISGLAIPPMGMSENNFEGERNWYSFGYGFGLKMKDHLTFFSVQDAHNSIIVNQELWHFCSARYCKPVPDEELGYKLYVDNCNDAVVMYPYNKQTRLTELPKGLERGIALRYANRSRMKVYKKWSEICAESEEIRKSISGNIPQLNLPESPCEEPEDPDMSRDQNYIHTRTFTKQDGTHWIDQIQYFDGLGRPNQTVQAGISPQGKDLVTLQEYDAFGRESAAWLPGYGTGQGAYTDPSNVKTASLSLNDDGKPYSLPVYEASPLNRVLEQYGPGAGWHQDYTPAKGKAVRTAYLTNGTAYPCIQYTVTGTNQSPALTKGGNYEAGQLYVTEIKDEDGNTSYEFKDKLGQVVLTRQVNDNGNHDTYYVYNDFGNLCFVLPPRINDEGITQARLNELAYQYKYDNRNRCIAKKIPGTDWIRYVYDKADRLIYSQDGEQYNRNPKEWTFTIPDVFGRTVLTGISRDTISVSNKVVKAVYASNGSYKRYNIQVDGVNKQFATVPDILSAGYYDNYDFRGMAEVPANGTEYIPEAGYGTWYGSDYSESNRHKNKGQLTGTLTALMNADGTISQSYLYSVMYYDNKGRLVQAKSNNHLAGGIEKEYIAYNFTGQPTQRKHIHQATGKDNLTEVYTYSYDHAGRLLATTHQLNNGTTVTLAENTYDELGRLRTNKKGNVAGSEATYGYNVRSWMKSIASSLFTENLTYTHSGNISSMDWIVNGQTRKYDYGYDKLSRLKSAAYTGIGHEKYSTSYSYDKHGNIKTLQRYGKKDAGTNAADYGLVDDLTMEYTGNQLKFASDAIADIQLNASFDFKEYTKGTGVEYTYNTNGAMVKDLNKGISQIQYNNLNLPRIVDIKNRNAEGRNEYTYSASGLKLKVIQKWNPNYLTAPVIGSNINVSALTESISTDYVGNIIYENGALKRILVDGGYNEDGNYYFYMQDHLGNNRIVADAAASVKQSTHYYPFGMPFADATGKDIQPYKYNGKELDSRNGLNMYDYGARYLAMDIPVLPIVDPLAEKYYSISPYAYVGNNPIRLVDVNGKEWGIVVNANGTMTITVSVNFSASSNLNLTAKQLDQYRNVLSSQLNSTIQEASGGLISASMSFEGGRDPGRLTPSIHLDQISDPDKIGDHYNGFVNLYINNMDNLQEFAETGIHELFHTLRLDHPFEKTQAKDVELIWDNNGKTYKTTPNTDSKIMKNIMNYNYIPINGKTFKQLFNSNTGLNSLTRGQIQFILKEIYKQMSGYGILPKQRANEKREEYEKRAAEYYHDYWN
jgi:RHS repeat-associated protein